MRPNPRRACAAFIGALSVLLVLGGTMFANRDHQQEPYLKLTARAQVLEEARGQALTTVQAWHQAGWQPATADNLAAPRSLSTLWLRLPLSNLGATTWERWLEVTPWRVGEVDLYQFRRAGVQALAHRHVGAPGRALGA